MKKINQYKIYLFLLTGILTACTKMESVYDEFVVPGGLTYAGKATSPAVYPGLNRVKIAWLRGSDPSVIKATVYWNNYADSVAVPVPAGQDTISVVIDNLVEKSYSFVIKTFDVKGNASIPAEVFGAAYGEKYQAQLLTRPINSTLLDAQGKITIEWGSADISNGAIGSEVKYTDVNGAVKVVTFPATSPTSVITDMKANTNYQFRTLFKPDSLSIDNFYTGYSNGDFYTFDKKDWKVTAFSDQYSGADNAAANVITGTAGDRWHTSGAAYPHFVTIDMGVERSIVKFGVWRTTYATANGDNRAPIRIQFLVSKDNVTWTDAGTYPFNNELNGEQAIQIPNLPRGRYFRLVGLTPATGNAQFMTLGEISAYGF
ncbi:DUF4998 domain-containing protein [Pedobacter metabolipauper]|uniref:F5/8 type C domain-containing protein n=1 Tax=Pedobacter metabolipauper TaxID=425513 RepID=A0A4R6ST18_9SPHI|nr:DUF4998 domain-containing protein [Pedobacter metabolipauper]TDQ08096.1 F5/8 type C domain-containing protein [Pedobacter metabolipauper]